MAETKYGKYILKGARKGNAAIKPGITMRTLEEPEDWSGIRPRLNWKYITQPVIWPEEPHSHECDEFLCFTTCNPAEPKELGAEIEISLGEEGEKHTINTPSVVCIPKGMVHTPVNFKKVDKPVLFCNIYFSSE